MRDARCSVFWGWRGNLGERGSGAGVPERGPGGAGTIGRSAAEPGEKGTPGQAVQRRLGEEPGLLEEVSKFTSCAQ